MPRGDTDEAILIEQAKYGDHEAFNELYTRHDSQVYRFIRRRTDNDTDAQHIAQDTRINVWQEMQTYNPVRRSFLTFVKFWASIIRLH